VCNNLGFLPFQLPKNNLKTLIQVIFSLFLVTTFLIYGVFVYVFANNYTYKRFVDR
jgi:hypothetical protein